MKETLAAGPGSPTAPSTNQQQERLSRAELPRGGGGAGAQGQEEVTHNKHANPGERRAAEPEKGDKTFLELHGLAPREERSSISSAEATRSGHAVRTQPCWGGQMATRWSCPGRGRDRSRGLRRGPAFNLFIFLEKSICYITF